MDWVLVATGFGPRLGGGLFVVDPESGSVRRVDAVSTTGACWDADHARFTRLLQVREGLPGAELVEYDELGVARYLRLDDVREAHDVLPDPDGGWLVVSTSSNSVVRVARDGTVASVATAPGEGDAWHLSCLHRHADGISIAAFGRGSEHRSWVGPENAAKGLLLDLPDFTPRIDDLTRPHTPRRLRDGSWLLCESGAGTLTHIPADGAPQRTIDLGGWTRGLVVDEDACRAWVGVSSSRVDAEVDEGRTASIATVDLDAWSVVSTTSVASDEIYELVAVPAAFATALDAGFHTNELRVRELQALDLFGLLGTDSVERLPLGAPIPEADRTARIVLLEHADAASLAAIGGTLSLRVENASARALVSAPPYPVHVGYRWRDAVGAVVAEGRTTLTEVVVQEDIGWFGDSHPSALLALTVERRPVP